MRTYSIILSLAAVFAVCPVMAQTTQPAEGTKAAEQEEVPEHLVALMKLEREKYIRGLHAQLGALFAQKKYDEALAVLVELNELQPNDPTVFYNVACVHAMNGHKKEALQALAGAAELGYHSYHYLINDKDLKSLHEQPMFAEIAKQVLENDRRKLPPYEKGIVINSVHRVEMWPAGGLNVRVRFSKRATAERPQTLVIWMHPAGGSMNKVVESITTTFTDRGFATVIPTQKAWRGWTNEEVEALFKRTLPTVGELKVLDVSRPILMGYDAGGQKALEVWSKNPAAFGGLIISGAYPIDREHYAKHKELKTIEVADGGEKTPILALIGENDQNGTGAKVWREAEKVFKAKGIPITVIYVRGRAHEWLADDRLPDVRRWLEHVRAGKLPGATVAEQDGKSKSSADQSHGRSVEGKSAAVE